MVETLVVFTSGLVVGLAIALIFFRHILYEAHQALDAALMLDKTARDNLVTARSLYAAQEPRP